MLKLSTERCRTIWTTGSSPWKESLWTSKAILDQRAVRPRELVKLLCDILCKCQDTLEELSIDTKIDTFTEKFLATSLSALYEEHRMRFRKPRTLHLNTSTPGIGYPSLTILSVLRDMTKSTAADGTMYSSVKYLSVGDGGMGFTPAVIEGIIRRFVGLESLMLKGRMATINGRRTYSDLVTKGGIYRAIQEHCP
ncbi:hypothetical protein CMUS01_15780 [Colletotrichum musicola]|uniref:Uncharacterized protein n=1 Tax=Colletotrichum musicola TaxID=2175873 RepID=A0A8H6MLR4_9PEZI|nr:hypothetical protein CMUS01_15780 [Colletotrichum musicola]